jgi:hypothetical protein
MRSHATPTALRCRRQRIEALVVRQNRAPRTVAERLHAPELAGDEEVEGILSGRIDFPPLETLAEALRSGDDVERDGLLIDAGEHDHASVRRNSGQVRPRHVLQVHQVKLLTHSNPHPLHRSP